MQQLMFKKMNQDQQEATERAARAAEAARREQGARSPRPYSGFKRSSSTGKREALGAMKGVVYGEGFKGLGTSTNFFSLKGFKPIPLTALSTSAEREKAQTSQCFDRGCSPLQVPAWVQQTLQYQA